MSDLRVKFVGKEHSIPQDVLTYIELLAFTDNVQKQLANAFVRKLKIEIQKSNSGLLGDEDLAEEIEQQVGKFIAKLCDHGIFSRTIGDYLNNNKGYQYVSDVNKAALEKFKSLLMQRLDSLQEGYSDAVQRAESHVTGMGFSIWSGSFVNHAIYAAMQASTINKQEKEASAAYQREINELCTKLESDHDRQTSQYINNEYIPNMEAAFTVLAYELLDRYVVDLIENGKFNKTALDFVNIGRSNDLLKNLTLSNNKQAILENAFAACPYNVAVYMQAMKYELLDYDSFQTAKIFKQDHHVISFFRENWGEVSFPTKFKINYHCIDVWASLTDKTSADLLRILTEQYAIGIVKAYSSVAEMLMDKHLCLRVIEDCSENVILAGNAICQTKARSYVESIASSTIWSQLTENCGHQDLLKEVIKAIPGDLIFADKNAVDSFLIGELEKQFEIARQQLIPIATKNHQEYMKKALEDESARIRRSLQCKRVHRICKFILPALIIIPLLLRVVFVGMWCNDVKTFVAENIESQLEDELYESDSIANNMGLTGEYEINRLEYYKAEHTKSITVVPHVTVYSNSEDNFYSSQGFIVLNYLSGRETEAIARPWYIANDEYSPSVNFHMTVISPDGSEEICYNNYEKDDTRFFVYFPIGFSVFFILYSVAVILTTKKVKKIYTIENV